MAQGKPRPRLVITSQARTDLAEIWRWNAHEYGVRHANDYVAFLDRGIRKLPTTYKLGRAVDGRPELMFQVLRRRVGGHAHLVVYELHDDVLDVLHIFHSAQDWQNKL